jgi:hypothetical protein
MQAIRRSGTRRVVAATAAGVLLLLVATVLVTRLVSQMDAASLVAAQARSAAIAALEDQFVALGTADESAVDLLFAGAARSEMRGLKPHIRQMVTDQTDYPGKRTLSNVQVFSIKGDDATTMTMDIRAHVKQADMRGGRIAGYSEGEVDFHIVMVRDGDAWKISDLDWDWAPGFSP